MGQGWCEEAHAFGSADYHWQQASPQERRERGLKADLLHDLQRTKNCIHCTNTIQSDLVNVMPIPVSVPTKSATGTTLEDCGRLELERFSQEAFHDSEATELVKNFLCAHKHHDGAVMSAIY